MMNNEWPDIGGSHLLGRGLNTLDWAGESKECQKVGDTDSGRQVITCQGRSYGIGQHVTLQPMAQEDGFTESFSSHDAYKRHLQSGLETKGNYGAFSAGFKATFGSDITQFEEREAALHSHTVRLWKLSLAVSPDHATETFMSRAEELPQAFDPANAKAFFNFFVDFGADIVNEVVVGGSLNYAMSAAKSYLSKKGSLKAMVEAEYGAFASATGSTASIEEVKRHIANRSSRLTTHGGTHSINFSSISPRDYRAEVAEWRKSLPDSPRVVELKRVPVFLFLKDGATRNALEEAYQWYTGYKTEIDATWAESVMVIGRNRRQSFLNAAASGPALRTVFIDNKSKSTSESFHYPPVDDAPPRAFEQFWDALALLLKQKSGYKLLIATERWPRDPRYYPTDAMREALLLHGAQEHTLERWDSLTRHMQPCPQAGLTYALVGNDREEPGIDGLTAGFGEQGRDLNPRVKITARLCHDSFGRVKVVQTGNTLEDTKTVLYLMRNNTGDSPVLAIDPQNRTRLAMQTADTGNPGQLWYMPELEKCSSDIHHPTLLINYETGGCLQGLLDETDCRLAPIEPGQQQDDVIWDRRGGDIFHLLMVYCHTRNLCLTQVERRAAVRKWRQPHGMDWLREQRQPQH